MTSASRRIAASFISTWRCGGKVIGIPESGSVAHAKETAVALSLALTPQEIQTLNAAFPGPAEVK
jgi:diketogulonate reductase-like aldo/keto reductase